MVSMVVVLVVSGYGAYRGLGGYILLSPAMGNAKKLPQF
jgi:hypothetical protein